MFKLSEIKELMKLMDQTTLQELEIQNEGERLFIRKGGRTESVFVTTPAAQQVYAQAPYAVSAPAAVSASAQNAAPAGPAAASTAGLHTIVSPMVGTFYEASSPGTAPFVSIGSKVSEKTVVCIVEAMKLMNDISAEMKGEIVDILVENGQLVEYGQPLFLVKPE